MIPIAPLHHHRKGTRATVAVLLLPAVLCVIEMCSLGVDASPLRTTAATHKLPQVVVNEQDDNNNADDTIHWELVFEDTFDTPDLSGSPGGINTSKWSFDYGWQYGNEQNQYYTDRARNARVENGTLILEALYENLPVGPGKVAKYTSGSIFSKERHRYGLVEFMAKVPQGGPTHPALWLLGPTDITPWPWCGEIDVMECVGRLPGIDHGTFHTEFCNGPHGNIGQTATLPVEHMDTQWSNYSVLWTPTELTIYVNDIPYNHYYNDGQCDIATWPYNFHFEIIMDMSVGPKWGANSSSLPQSLVVDSVRWYQPLRTNISSSIAEGDDKVSSSVFTPFICREELGYLSLEVNKIEQSLATVSLPDLLFLQPDDRLEILYNLTRKALHVVVEEELSNNNDNSSRSVPGEPIRGGARTSVSSFSSPSFFEGLIHINSIAVTGEQSLLVNFTLLNLPSYSSSSSLLENISSNRTLTGILLETVSPFFQNITTTTTGGGGLEEVLKLTSLSTKCTLPSNTTSTSDIISSPSSSSSCYVPFQDPATGLPSTSNFSNVPVNLAFRPKRLGGTTTTTISAVEYNYGGEGIAYHDSTYWNLFAPPKSQLRSRPEWVDVKEIQMEEGSSQKIVGWFAAGEWLKFSAIKISGGNTSSREEEEGHHSHHPSPPSSGGINPTTFIVGDSKSTIPINISLTAANGARNGQGEVEVFLERSPNCLIPSSSSSTTTYPTFCPTKEATNWKHTFYIPFTGSWVDYQPTDPWSASGDMLQIVPDVEYTMTLVIKNPSLNLMSINFTQ